MTILTYKIKHFRDFSSELLKAKLVAEFALKTKSLTSKDVKHLGLPSVISNQILRKYSKNKTLKRVSSVNLVVPNQGIKIENQKIKISCLKLSLDFFKNDIEKINQIELDGEYAYVSCTIKEEDVRREQGYIGIDRNATGHIAVAAYDGKILKLGKNAPHVHKKFQAIRKSLQHKGKLKAVKKIKDKESRITKDINHKISRKIVNLAKEKNYAVVLEDLTGIRKSSERKKNKKFKSTISNWSFYQLQQFIEYKAKLSGVRVFLVDPYMTSQRCSRCGLIGERLGKTFKCPSCGHVDHADANAADIIVDGGMLLRF